ncbi:Uncharacterised protein [Providencia rettgeri]|nr:Uncharacterised protein [Providencia rettgeri]
MEMSKDTMNAIERTFNRLNSLSKDELNERIKTVKLMTFRFCLKGVLLAKFVVSMIQTSHRSYLLLILLILTLEILKLVVQHVLTTTTLI